MLVVLSMFLSGGCAAPVESGPSGPQAGDKQTFSADGVTFSMIYVPGKKFYSGYFDTVPAEVAYGYWMGETEVTFELWNTVYEWTSQPGVQFSLEKAGHRGNNNSGSDQQPATYCSWRHVIVWCNAATVWYNEKMGTNYDCVYLDNSGAVISAWNAFTEADVVVSPTALGFRLPDEDEWRLAARYKADLNNDGDIMDAGEYYPGNFASGATASTSHQAATQAVAVCDAASTATVASKLPNALGMYDVSGNAAEWCFTKDIETHSTLYSMSYQDSYLTFGMEGYFSNQYYEWIGFRLARSNAVHFVIVQF
jgi:sulfatase modifying factor 1